MSNRKRHRLDKRDTALELAKTGNPLEKYLPFADIETPKPQAGIWRLFAPDGRSFFGDSPIQCLREESSSRIPPHVALGRLARGLQDDAQTEPVLREPGEK